MLLRRAMDTEEICRPNVYVERDGKNYRFTGYAYLTVREGRIVVEGLYRELEENEVMNPNNYI